MVIAVDELYNYHVAPGCIVLPYDFTISDSDVLSDLILDFFLVADYKIILSTNIIYLVVRKKVLVVIRCICIKYKCKFQSNSIEIVK